MDEAANPILDTVNREEQIILPVICLLIGDKDVYRDHHIS